LAALLWAFPAVAAPDGAGDEIPLTVGRSVVLDHPDEVTRISITDPGIVDAVPISTREILLNAKTAGVSTLIIWSKSGERNFFSINVTPNLEQIQEHLVMAFPGEDIRVNSSRGITTLDGRVSAPDIVDRAIAMVSGAAGGQVVNNLILPPPPPDRQILIKVRFAELQRSASADFAVNLISTGAANTPAAISTQQFAPPSGAAVSGSIGAPLQGSSTSFTVSDLLNVFAFRPDLNLGAFIKALQSKSLIQILAEPNLVTTSGKEARFLVGGEFPIPILQGGAGAGAVTIQFREFGIRIEFLPEMTETGSIKMQITPEVSALDFANAVTFSGFLIPALSTRRIQTEVELMPGQSFAIGGLIDNRVQDTINRVPGLAHIPLLGKIFKSRLRDKNTTELLVLVTPEFPELYEAGDELPELSMPEDFLPPATENWVKWKN
jgi:pilus assembly protein CpaC